MKMGKGIQIISIVAAILLQGMGFAGLGLIWGIFILIGMIIFGLAARRFVLSWLPSLLLLLYIGVSCVGILSGVSPYLLAGGVATALAGWELSDHKMKSSESSINRYTVLFEKRRILLMASALLLGTLVAGIGLLITIQISFLAMAVIVLVTLFCLFRFFSLSRR